RRQGHLPPGRHPAPRHHPPGPGHLPREGVLHLRVPGQHRHRVPAPDRRPGRGARVPAARRPGRLPGDRLGAQLPDARGRLVSPDLYPFEGRSLDLRGLRYHYLDEGAGEPLVLLHGNPTWSFFYRDLIRGLRDRYRLIAPDHIGCGLSDKPGDDRYSYTLQSRVDDLDALLAHLGLREGLTLVLHDWGGVVGMAGAARQPDRVRRLVVLNTAAFRLPAGRRLPWQLRLVRDTPLGPLLVRGLGVFSWGLVRFCSVKPLPAA